MPTQPCCPYETTGDLAREVRQKANEETGRKKYTARPWNRYRTNELYWLVPSTEWPAYPYGKGFFKFIGENKSKLFTGLHVERGLSEKGVEAYGVKKSLILKEDWIWHKFQDGLKGALFDKKLQKMLHTLEIPLNIYLEIQSPSELNSWDIQSNPWFKIRKANEGVQLRKWKDEVTSDKLCEDLDRNLSLKELANHLEEKVPKDFFWVDFYVGALLPLCTDVSSSIEPWGPDDLWNNILSPWQSWFKKVP